MERPSDSSEAYLVFTKLKIGFVVLVVAAIGIWRLQDYFASFAADQRVTRTTLRTTEERDDARVLRAYQRAKDIIHTNATLTTEANPEQQTRDAVLAVTGSSDAVVIEQRRQMVEAMQKNFASEGPGELFDVGNRPISYPVPNAAYARIVKICKGVSLFVVLGALVMLASTWKASKLPVGALWGILATGFGALLLVLQEDAMPIWKVLVLLLPVALIVLVSVLTRRVRQAESWKKGAATILKSEVEVNRHRHVNDVTKVRNVPVVEYEFDAGSVKIHASRITLGVAPADNIDEVLKHYPVGATVPVYYNPDDPNDCTLERDPPVSLGCLWTGTILVAVAYELVVLSLWNVVSINSAIQKHSPTMHHPVVVLLCGGFGLFAVMAGIWNMLHPQVVPAWPETKGLIVSSEVEVTREDRHASGHAESNFYQAVIEYRYVADGREYHGSTSSASITIKTGKAAAEAEAAQYTPDMEVPVYYHPKKPFVSSLKPRGEIAINGRKPLLVGLVLLSVAVYAAMN